MGGIRSSITWLSDKQLDERKVDESTMITTASEKIDNMYSRHST